MKRIYTTIFAAALAAVVFAQKDNTLKFVDANGKEVKDGSTVTVDKVEDDGFGTLQIPTGLFVLNTSSEKQGVGLTFTISEIPNGSMSVCFPKNCLNYETVGSYDNGTDLMDANQNKTLQTEWFPAEKGTTTATFTISRHKVEKKTVMGVTMYEAGEKIADCSTVTVKFVYNDPTAIKNVDSEASKTVVARYNANGQQLSSAQPGLNIVKYSDGSIRKVVVK